MRTTRRSLRSLTTTTTWKRSSGGCEADKAAPPVKRPRCLADDDDDGGGGGDVFDWLPDDLVVTMLSKLASAAAAPADVAGVLLTCKRFKELGSHPLVLSRVSAAAIAVRAGSWSEAAHRFLKRCADAGNHDACYFLGMLRFYCLGGRATGAALLARAAAGGHAAALYALAVIQFNGSGGSKADKDPRAGVALCARAAWLGHAAALRELGHCLQDGYGARRDAAAGRRLLLHAAARELLLWNTAADGDADIASQFMVAWWTQHQKEAKDVQEEGEGDSMALRLCSHVRCGRRETRRREFRQCSVCGAVHYCSRACQALDWKRAHRAQCGAAAVRWLAGVGMN